MKLLLVFSLVQAVAWAQPPSSVGPLPAPNPSSVTVNPNIPVQQVTMTVDADRIQQVTSRNGGLANFVLVINPRIKFNPPIGDRGFKLVSIPVSAVYVEKSPSTNHENAYVWDTATADYICAILGYSAYKEMVGMRGIEQVERGTRMVTLEGNDLVTKRAVSVNLPPNNRDAYLQQDLVWTELPCANP